MKPLYYSFLLALCAASLASCAHPNYVSDYDYRKAEEAYENKDYGEALRLVNKQLRATPKHVDALFLLSHVHYQRDENEAAVTDLSRAIRCYRGDSDVVLSSLHAGRGIILFEMQRYAEAAKAFAKAARLARKDDAEHVQDILFRQADASFRAKDLSAAEKVYREMLDADPDDSAAMVGMARNLQEAGRYEESLPWLERAESVDDTYAAVYKFRIRALDTLGRVDECIDTAIRYFEVDEDVLPGLVVWFGCNHYTYAVAKIKSMAGKADDPTRWQLLLTSLYEDHGDYTSAVEVYDDLLMEYDDEERLYYYRSHCYKELGAYRKAVADLTKAYEMSEDIEYLGARGDALRTGGFYEEAIRDYDACIEEDPSQGYYYYAAGWSYDLAGNRERALAYYNKGIDIDKSYAYLFLSRADLHKLEGRVQDATEDYEAVLTLDTVPETSSCRQYALLGLGRADEAEAWMNQVIACDTLNPGNYYDRACLYGRMGRINEALAALDTAFQKGFRRFVHLEHDDDMDPLRKLPAYKALVEHYQFLFSHPQLETNSNVTPPDTAPAESDSLVAEIPMRRKPGGTYEVPCEVNGLPLKFIFDTGASDVTLSSVEADFMLKNDYLAARDLRGSRRYLTASGSICDGALVCLKEVKVGDVTLKNIEASVVKNQQAPLLLGQSALEHLGTITIDNKASKLIITSK